MNFLYEYLIRDFFTIAKNAKLKTAKLSTNKVNGKHLRGISAAEVFKTWPCLIMVIELSGVQFGLKSYAWFQFDLKSQVWFQTKIARHEVQLPLYYIHFEIAEVSQY